MICEKSIRQTCEKILNTDTKAGLDAVRAASKKVAHKTAEATGELIRKRIAEKFVKAKPVPDENLRNVGEINIPPEKGQKISKELKQIL